MKKTLAAIFLAATVSSTALAQPAAHVSLGAHFLLASGPQRANGRAQ